MQPREPGGDGASADASSAGIKADGAADRMRRAVAATTRGSGTRDELAAAAHDLVVALRSAHEPPEQMLLKIKEILGESGLRPTYATDAMDGVATDATVYRDVIAWSIRYYYENGDGSRSRD